jgi:hypothetical protein
LKYIGDYAFCGCFGLTSIHLPNGLKNIGKFAFRGCYGLKNLYLYDGTRIVTEEYFNIFPSANSL